MTEQQEEYVIKEFDFEKFKRENKRNLIILDKVFKIMKPIFKNTNSVEISVSEDGHPQLRFTQKKRVAAQVAHRNGDK